MLFRSCSVAVVLSFWFGFAVRLTCAVFFFSGCLFVLDDSFGGEETAGDGMNYPAWLITLSPLMTWIGGVFLHIVLFVVGFVNIC